VRDSVLGRRVYVHAGAQVDECVIFDNCDIGRNAKLRRCILEENVLVPENAVFGYDHEEDKKLNYLTGGGIVVVEGTRTPLQSISTI
jgi:glucose-1-phosphate adenylyltransferase